MGRAGRPKKPYQTNSPTYRVWSDMKSRCLNPTHHAFGRYGGRGITVCERWVLFENFLSDMGHKPEGLWLERKNNSKGYSAENCYWATPIEQQNNKRSNVILEHEGMRMTVSQWAKVTGIDRNVLFARLRTGWTIAETLRTPVAHKQR